MNYLQCGQVSQQDSLQVDLFFEELRSMEHVLDLSVDDLWPLAHSHCHVQDLRLNVCVIPNVDDEDVILLHVQNGCEGVDEERV